MIRRELIGEEAAGRLFGYVRVLTQAKKTGRVRITSEQLGSYTNVNPSEVRRDLSQIGKLGRRGVRYSVDRLLDELRELLFLTGASPIVLVGAGRLGEAIANSPIFADYGITIAAIVDRDPDKVGREFGHVTVSDYQQLADLVRRRKLIVGVLAVPAASAQQAASDLVAAGVKIILNYSQALLDLPVEVRVLTSNPAAQLIAALALQRG